MKKRRHHSEFYMNKESTLQSNCESYLNLLHIPYIRIPDVLYSVIFGNSYASKRIPVYVKKVISGFLKGLPDLIILKEMQGTIYNKALCIELKSKTGRLTKEQRQFGAILNLVVVRSFDDFKNIVNEFYNVE